MGGKGRQTEARRLKEAGAAWRLWGPYLAERAWATVREDYSADGAAWRYFPHDHARSRAYRWNEDGIAGISDIEQRLCFALALWNGRDPILKERFFGLTNEEGSHGEDVKEYYYYLDSTPTHSYMKLLYKYPQAAYPYSQLANASRDRRMPEFELIDTGVFAENRYFDVIVEYAKAAPDDILIRISATNRGPDAASLHLLPTLWFRNTWAWEPDARRPALKQTDEPGSGPIQRISAAHRTLGGYHLYCECAASVLFTENETNKVRLFNVPNETPYVKDAFHNYLIHGQPAAINPERVGTKAAAHYVETLAPGATWTIRLRLTTRLIQAMGRIFEPDKFDAVFTRRMAEADAFYASLYSAPSPDDPGYAEAVDRANILRQALAGMLWTKQFYHYDIPRWLAGDPTQPKPPESRREGRNADWMHFNSYDVLSMPDKWEYPWFAAWDTAFHCLPLGMVDMEFAKNQLLLLLREWYQHPNGQIPAYEWHFNDVNPPVFAWAAWRLYKMERARHGRGDRAFLERVFHKLLLNFTWWVNRKDSEGDNVFQGGFLGLDNIGVFDRSQPLPTGGRLEQADGTSWMGMFCLDMLVMALELARENPVYEDVATKFFEHFLYIAGAMNNIGGDGIRLWDEGDQFFYDVLHLPDGTNFPLKVRSLVGLIPLLAAETIEPEMLAELPSFRERLKWFLNYRPDLAGLISRWHVPGAGERRLLALVRGHRMKRLLARMLDPEEFLSEYGIRSLSKYHEREPYRLSFGGMDYSVRYEPGEAQTGLFGGNSNWRGPVWFPLNYLLIEALREFHRYYSDDFRVEYPTGSGQFCSLAEIADALSGRLIRLFTADASGRRAFHGDLSVQQDPQWRDHLLFYEYFHGDSGKGLGASHQTGWTGLVANLIAPWR